MGSFFSTIPHSHTLTPSPSHTPSLKHKQEGKKKKKKILATHKNELLIHFWSLYTCPTFLGQSSPIFTWPAIGLYPFLISHHSNLSYPQLMHTICIGASLALFYMDSGALSYLKVHFLLSCFLRATQ